MVITHMGCPGGCLTSGRHEASGDGDQDPGHVGGRGKWSGHQPAL